MANAMKEGELAFSLENEPVKLGEILKYTLTIDNPGQTAHYVNVSVSVSVCCDVRNRSDVTHCGESTIYAGFDDVTQHSLYVMPANYSKQLGVSKSLSVEVVAKVKGTGQKFKQIEKLDFPQPSIKLACGRDTVRLGDAVVLNLTVPNPRLVPLRNTNIVIESAEHLGLPYAVEIGEIKPKHKVSATVTIPTKSTGRRQCFVASCICTEARVKLRGICFVNVID